MNVKEIKKYLKGHKIFMIVKENKKCLRMLKNIKKIFINMNITQKFKLLKSHFGSLDNK